jgi:hypothetical protein
MCTCPRSARPRLVDFWTLTCINWLGQEPYVRAWSQAYRNDGARDRLPVTVDNDYTTSERAIRRLLGIERELVGVEGLGVLIGVPGFPP